MKEKILQRLFQLEKVEKIKILFAVESGSRAWGFDSKDSDYDVRFIYVRQLEWYLSIEEKSDVIEIPIDGLLDISGWDVKKALQLFKKSNPPLYEWLTSPYVYLEENSFTKELNSLKSSIFSPIASMHHYLHMAEGNFKKYLTKDKVRLKKYLYVLRPLFACMWIEKNHTPPPMEFNKLYNALQLSPEITQIINNLLTRKKSGNEADKEPSIPSLNNFLAEQMEHFKIVAKSQPVSQKANTEKLDQIFYGQVMKYKT